MTTNAPYSISNKMFDIELNNILKADNVATLLNKEEETRLLLIARSTFETDKTESAPIMEDMNTFMKLALQITEPSSTTSQRFDNNIPLIFKAATRFNADAYPALTKDRKIAKFVPEGSDGDIIALDEKGEELMNEETGKKVIELEGGKKQKKAHRVQKYVNYFLRKKIKGFIPSLDRLTLIFAITGSIFKKTYFNRYTNLPESKLVMPNNVIVNPAAENMIDYPVSEIRFYTQNEMRQKMITGEFKEYDLKEMGKIDPIQETNTNNNNTQDTRIFADNDTPIQVIEQHCLIDLDGDGYKEPYIITFSGEDKLLSIQKRFNEKSIKRQESKGNKIIEIISDNYWTHYQFMPNPQGTFYALGFGFILHKFNATLNSCINQLLKAAYRANQDRGLFDKDKIDWEGDVLELRDNQFRGIRVTEGRIADVFHNFQSSEPSPGLFNLLVFLLDLGKDLSNINDVLTGDFPVNASPTTVLAMIQQGMKEFKVVYTRIYYSLEEELEKIYKIIGEHPELYEEDYFNYLDDPEADFKKDFDFKSIDIIPAADSEIVLDSERAAKASILAQFKGDPAVNQFVLAERLLRLNRIEDIEDLLNEPPNSQEPDPQAELVQQQIALEERKQKNEEDSIRLRNEELRVKKATAAANAAKQDIEGDKLESEVELNRAKTIETLTKAGKEASAEIADALYEPKSNNQ